MGKVSKISCSVYCHDHTKCVISSESTSCSQCIKKSHHYNLYLAESEWEKMELECTQLKAQLKEIKE